MKNLKHDQTATFTSILKGSLTNILAHLICKHEICICMTTPTERVVFTCLLKYSYSQHKKNCTAGFDVHKEIWCMLETLWGFCKQQHAVRFIDFVPLQWRRLVYLHCNASDTRCMCTRRAVGSHTVCIFFFNICINFYCDYDRVSQYAAPCSRVCHAYKEPDSNNMSQFTFSEIFHSISLWLSGALDHFEIISR